MEARGGPRPAPGTLTQLFFDAVTQFNRPDALQYKALGSYRSISHSEVSLRVRHASRGLTALGVKRGDRVAILSENRPEWAIADYACLTACLTDVPVYPTLPADQITHVLNDSGALAVFVSNADQAAKVAQIRAELPALRYVIAFGRTPEGTPEGGCDLTLADVEERGRRDDTAERAAEYRRTALAVDPDAVATILYT